LIRAFLGHNPLTGATPATTDIGMGQLREIHIAWPARAKVLRSIGVG
jgi:hypothetical protein